MARYRSNFYALAVLCLALILASTRAHAASASADYRYCSDAHGHRMLGRAGSLPPSEDDVQGLARAYRDLLAAELAVRDDPAAVASFGPMLRDARANLEAGLAALAEHAPSTTSASATHAPRARESSLQLHHHGHGRPMIWA